METESHIVDAVAEIYTWIDSQVADFVPCKACGKCCDFEAYDHRLFITTPELLFFAHRMSPEPIKPMTTGQCPYNIDKKCTVHPHRFAACRIFSCTGDVDAQNRLSEAAVAKLKSICEQSNIPYQYVDLKAALSRICRSGEGS